STRCRARSIGRMARPSSTPSTRASRNPPRRPSTVTSTPRGASIRNGRRSMTINDSVDWSVELGGPVRVALIQAGTFRSDAGALFGPVPWVLWRGMAADEPDEHRRLLQALNCLLIETPSGRVLVETGIGERVDDKTRAMRGYEGPWLAAARER